jgi:hypothetical protein
MPQLSDNQLMAFDTEYVTDRLWVPVKRCIDRDFPGGRFTFLDVGGGNGVFADRVLANYPASTGVVLDNSAFLLRRSQPHPRKWMVLENVENLERVAQEKYDLVFLNWVLHHLIVRSSYLGSKEHMRRVLNSILMLLTEQGRVSIYENMYNGLIIDSAPSWIVYQLTSSRTMAQLFKKYGANTAGVGVCFHSYRQWFSIITQIGFKVLDYTDDLDWSIPWTWMALLHIGNIRCGHFWLSRSTGLPIRS